MKNIFVPIVVLSSLFAAGCASDHPGASTAKPAATVRHGQTESKPVLESSVMTPGSTTTKIAFKVGDDQMHVVVHQKQPVSRTMVNVHDDENTSVEAGLTNVNQFGGRLIELVHSGERLFVFHVDGKKYSFDPNRIFSDAGITDTLKKHGEWSEAAQAATKSFATQYIHYFALEKEPVIVALHNTSDGTFSINSYAAGGEHATASAEVHVSAQHSKFDFFYVTDRRFYDYLKAHDFNVTLQDNKDVEDDGSLSVFFAHKGIPYLNIEAEIGHLKEQIKMVNAAREMLDELMPVGNKP